MRELRVRGTQELVKLSERLLGSSTREASDRAFLREIDPGMRNGSDPATAGLVAARIFQSFIKEGRTPVRGAFFPSLSYRDEIVEVMRGRFAADRRALIERAERAARGHFDLLGLRAIRFGSSIDWRLEPTSGKRTPLTHWSTIDYLDPGIAGDKKVTWELNRHGHFVTLGQAYWVTGNEGYAVSFVSQANSWMDANPPNRGINWTSSLEVAFRSIAWIWTLHMFADSRHLTPEFQLRVLKFLISHGHHIQTYVSHYFSPNTHLTGEALGLFYLGTALPELRRAKEWRELGSRIMIEQLPVQVRADGVYFEQATYYHRYTTDFYTHLLVLARAAGHELPKEAQEKLALMLDYLMWITRPDGSSPLIGDDDGGRLLALGVRNSDDFRDTLATGAALLGRGDWKFVAGAAPVEILWLLGPEGLARYDELNSGPPRERSRAFDDSGYYVMRDGWSKDSSYLIMDCGAHGALSGGHAHADALSFEFAAIGKTWLEDPGTFTYTGDPKAREEFRATDAHNTVTVDSESQSIPTGPFSWGQTAHAVLRDFIVEDGFQYLEGSHDGYTRLPDPVHHTRAVLFVGSNRSGRALGALSPYLAVRDSFDARGRHRYAIKYHLSPDCLAAADGNRVIISEPKGRRLTIEVYGQTTPRARIDRGWISRAYGHRQPGLVVVFEVDATGPQDFTSFIIASEGGRAIHVQQKETDDSRALGFQVTSGQLLDVLLLNSGPGTATCGPISASGLLAWGRFSADRLAEACLIRGREFRAADSFEFASSVPVRHCAIEQSIGRIQMSVDGAGDIGVAPQGTEAKVMVDGVRFNISPKQEKTIFVNGESGWRLANISQRTF